MSNLLPCSFPDTCTPVLIRVKTSTPGRYAGALPIEYRYYCDCCGAGGPARETEQKAAEAWNDIRRMMPSYAAAEAT